MVEEKSALRWDHKRDGKVNKRMSRGPYHKFFYPCNYKKTVVVQNKSNLLLKIFCETFKYYNY